jgi:hypothetical protein
VEGEEKERGKIIDDGLHDISDKAGIYGLLISAVHGN